MIEFYVQIKFVHVLAAILSGGLFAGRGLLMLRGSPFATHLVLRALAYTFDTILLTAALMLAAVTHQYPFAQTWLTAKVLLLVIYIVLAMMTLRQGQNRAVRAGCFVTALAVFLFIVSIARAHSPLGVIASLLR